MRNRGLCTLMLLWGVSVICLNAQNGQSDLNPDVVKRLIEDGKLYKTYDFARNLRLLAKSSGKDVDGTPVGSICPTVDVGEGDAKAQQVDNYQHPVIAFDTELSDLIAVVTVKRNISAFTEHEGFIFTDSEVQTEQVIAQSRSDSARKYLNRLDQVTVTSPGGEMIVDGHRVRSFLPDTLPLILGHKCVLFLRYIPASDSYERIGMSGFDLSTPKATVLQKDAGTPLSDLYDDKEELVRAIHSSVVHSGVDQVVPR